MNGHDATRFRPVGVQASGWGWRHAGRRAWALRSLELAIEPGERVLLLGASGSGKSTLLAALAGVLGGDEEGEEEGALLVDGRPAASERGRSGYLLQDPDSQVVLARVGDDVAFGCENLGIDREETWRRVNESLDAVGLDLPFGAPTSQLSGGQKQRLALAGLLAMRPGLLLLDEPTANLDPAGVGEVVDAVSSVVRNTRSTLVVVEHRVSVWANLVDRVIVLDSAGGILADGAADTVFRVHRAALESAGVWVPGSSSNSFLGGGHGAPRSGGGVLLRAESLVVGPVVGAPLLSGLDLEIREGSATAVTGRNGTGKSTLSLTVGGLIPPLGGKLDAAPLLARGAKREPIRWRSSELLTRIGSVFQSPEHQLLATTVRRELEIGPRALRMPAGERARRVDELLDRLHLGDLADANPFTLSGGQKRRLTVATVLATRPSLLVFDEPTFGQDARTWRELTALIAELIDAGHAVVAVTHDAAFVEALGAVECAVGQYSTSAARAGRTLDANVRVQEAEEAK